MLFLPIMPAWSKNGDILLLHPQMIWRMRKWLFTDQKLLVKLTTYFGGLLIYKDNSKHFSAILSINFWSFKNYFCMDLKKPLTH